MTTPLSFPAGRPDSRHSVIAGYASDAFSVETGWALGAGIIAAYALSRGLAKAGSREGPFLVDLTDEEP